MLRSERGLAPEIRLQLVDGLYYPFASLIAGALAGIFIAVTVTILAENLLLEVLADIAVAVALIRIAIGLRYISRKKPADAGNVRFWELAYAVPAALYSLLLGLLAMVAVTTSEDATLHLMLTTLTAGFASSITGRNAGRPKVALMQLYLAAAPMCLGLVLHPTLFYQVIGCALFVFMFGMTDITISVRNTIVGALETKRKNAELAASYKDQATLFDAALNNMSHGLGMFDRAGTLLVWNHKLTEILACPETTFEAGMSLEAFLARLAHTQEKTELRAPLVEAIRHCIRSGNAPQRFVKLSDARVVTVSCQSMENGNAVIVFEDVTEQAKAHERIEQLAWTDELTGLMNRASFKEVFRKALDVLPADGALALHLIDLDQFKAVNDTLGHPIGDLLLVAVSERIHALCGVGSHIARLGGDEFVIIQRLHPDGTGAEELAHTIIDSIGKTFEISGHRINIGASIGVALAPRHGMLPDILLKRADMALYQSKAKGRNTVMVFEDEMDRHAQERRLLELDIRAAIAERQFSLVFQPIVDIARGDIASFETLIRWRHPTRGNVSPAEFIPVAEETGLIVELGRWVFEEAIRLSSAWPGTCSVAINFSAAQFVDRQFPAFLADTLAEYGMPAERVELEITETALLDSSTATLDMLAEFRAMGIRISLDDFGTGYSSLSQLRTFPFNKIKIDGSFVRDLGRNASSVAVIRAVTSIGSILGMTVVGECVESEEQLEALTIAGCDQIQGYLFGKPMPPEAIAALITEFPEAHRRRTIAA